MFAASGDRFPVRGGRDLQRCRVGARAVRAVTHLSLVVGPPAEESADPDAAGMPFAGADRGPVRVMHQRRSGCGWTGTQARHDEQAANRQRLTFEVHLVALVVSPDGGRLLRG